jgi:hypothetical protein
MVQRMIERWWCWRWSRRLTLVGSVQPGNIDAVYLVHGCCRGHSPGGKVQYSAAGTVRWQQQQEESSARYQQPVLMIEGGVQLSEDDDVSAGSQQCQVRSASNNGPGSRVTARGLSKVQYSTGNNDQRCYTVRR